MATLIATEYSGSFVDAPEVEAPNWYTLEGDNLTKYYSAVSRKKMEKKGKFGTFTVFTNGRWEYDKLQPLAFDKRWAAATDKTEEFAVINRNEEDVIETIVLGFEFPVKEILVDDPEEPEIV